MNKVEERKALSMPLSDEQLNNIGGGTDPGGGCGVQEGQFPQMGKCCSRADTISGTTYNKNCDYCSIWASLPVGVSLVVTHIFECSLYGYSKRI